MVVHPGTQLPKLTTGPEMGSFFPSARDKREERSLLLVTHQRTQISNALEAD